MEEVRAFQYTEFPNLTATHQLSQTTACLQTHWQGQFSSLPDEVLIVAWACLLQAFTRVSIPVFSLNGQPIGVDISNKRWMKIQIQEKWRAAGSPSHLTLQSGQDNVIDNEESMEISLASQTCPSTIQTPLSFQYNSSTGYGLLSSSGNVPGSFLGEIERQLLQMVVSVLPQRCENASQSVSSPSPSALNVHRKFLDGPLFLHELISKNWSKKSTAIDFLDAKGDRIQISYTRLNHLTDNLARKIVGQLSPAEDSQSCVIIPVYIPQSPALYCACIAVLKANTAFCPIGLDMPYERMKYILEDIDAEIVLTLPELTPKITQVRPGMRVIEVQVVQKRDDAVDGYESSPCKTPKSASSDSLAYVMYTSGSTGVPKGVAIPHAAVTQALLAHDECVPKFERFLQFAAPTFDVSIFETFFPLFRGATLVTRHREHMLGDLPGTLTTLSVDAAELTPTVACILLRAREAAPCLRLLLTIGEMLTRAVIEEFAERPDRKGILLPMYGPTEASIHCTLAPSITTEAKVGIIGRPLSTVTSLIIQEAEETGDGSIEVLPIGQVGELAIAGQLATGYLNRYEQTKVSFRYHSSYGRIYRTGDRARLLPNGDLECLGRISSGQVKIRGQRVELGEIEQVICKTAGIQTATISVIDDVLVAFCIISSKDASHEKIMSVCKLWLPSFMIPGDIVLLIDKVPRLASGKIDKRQLEVDYRVRMRASTYSQDNSHGPVEYQIMRAIEAEISRSVSPSDDLWSAGLDSLKAIKLASRLREEGLWPSVSDILEAENVIALAKRLEILKSADTLSSNPQIEVSGTWEREASAKYALESLSSYIDTTEIEVFRPCSPSQIAMLVETTKTSSLYFNYIKLELPDAVTVPVFCEAFQILAHHNKILRSGFVKTDSHRQPFCQIIWKHLVAAESDPTALLHGQLDRPDTAELLLLHPLRLHFTETKEGRVCTIHIHHALYDGWSFELILQDLEQIISGKTPKRPQFDDVIMYQLRHRLEAASNETKRYWQDLLKDTRPATFPKLLTKQVQRNRRQSFSQAFVLDLQDLTSTCQTLHVSRQSVLSGAFAILLSSYVGNSDVVFGGVSSGRAMPIRGIEQIIGPCISTFPIRLDSSKLRTAGDVINSIQRQYHNFLQYDGITLSEIKTLSGIAGTDPIFDCLFIWQEGPESLQSPERILTIIDASDSLDYTLVLEIEPRDGQLQAKFSFDTTKLTADHAILFLSQMNSLLTVFTQVPETLVRDCYRDMKIEEMSIENASFCTFDQRFTLTSTIDALANQDPLRTAIEFVDTFDPQTGQLKATAINYSELYHRSNHISNILATKGVLPDAVISILIEKSVELYIAILGVIRSGAAYLAIDPRTPPDRVRTILEDSHCRIVICEDLSTVSAGPYECYSISGLESTFQGISPLISPSLNSHGGNLAYVAYTSGSTGDPKGVLITRNNVLSNIDCLSRIYPSNADSKLLQAYSQGFDVSAFEIFFTWHMGMSLCVAANDILFRDIEHLIRCTSVSHLSLTPSVAALIEPENVPNVRILVTAGEPMNSKAFNSWMARGLYQGYGPSETTNLCNIRPKVSQHDFPNNVGPPLPNTSIFICQGESFRLVPKGAVGYIWIGGEQVGRGYLHNDELTRESFSNHATYGRLYRSGDIGRLLSDGSLVIVSRNDDQVKLRGQGIELGDINHAIISSGVVKDATTLILHAASNENAQLVSFWTPDFTTLADKDEAGTQTRAILAELEARLPAYMIPDLLVPIDNIPLTKQGKIDRKILIEQFESYNQALLQCSGRANGHQDSERFSQHEAIIAQSVADVVGHNSSSIHRDTSFFALGLDSIKSIRMSQNLRKLGYGQVGVSAILDHASVRRLAAYLSSSASTSADTSKDDSREPVILKIIDDEWERQVNSQFTGMGFKIAKIIPCTPLQGTMLSSCDVKHSDSYQNELVFRVSGDLENLKLSWEAMLSRHQLLKTGFATTASSVSAFAQVVLEDFALPWSGENALPDRNLGAELQEGFILPPYSLKATRSGDGGVSTLTLRMHHALYDGEAMNLLLGEVETHYLGGQLLPVVPFDRYLKYMLSLDPTSVNSFWHSQLDGYTPQLVTEIFRPAIREDESAHFTTSLACKVSLSTLKAELKRMPKTLLAIVQTSWARLLSFYLRKFDVCFGNVYSGRNIPVQDADQIIGPCFNTLPVRVGLERLQTIADLSERLQETNRSVIPYQPSSLRTIQKSCNALERPLFDTLLLLQPEEHLLNSKIWTLVQETGYATFPIICEISPDNINDRLQMKLHVQGSQFPAAEACRLLENFDILLQHDIQYTQTSSQDFSIVKDKLPSMLQNPQTNPKTPSSVEKDHPDGSIEDKFSGLETKIRQILFEISETEITELSKPNSIFRFGLDSIDAVRIAAKLRQEGFNVTGSDILETSSVRGVAELCSKHLGSPKTANPLFDLAAFDAKYRSGVCNQISIPLSQVEAILPCTSTQSGILAEFINSDGRFYLNSLTLKLTGVVDVNRLKKAWAHVMSRHEMLRTGFVEIENAEHPFAMVTYQTNILRLPWNESADLDEVLERDFDSKTILDSLHKPPWRLLYNKKAGDPQLKLSILHALYDAQSLEIILTDVASIYNGDDLPPPEPIYNALSSILSESVVRDEELASFLSNLAKPLPRTRFPDLRVYNNELHGVSVAFRTCKISQHEIRRTCKQVGMSLQTAIQCAWAQLLAAYTGDRDVTFGVIFSGRISKETKESVAFPTINTLPIALHVGQGVRDLVEQASRLNAALKQRQFVPLSQIKRWLGVKEIPFDTVVVLQQYPSLSGGISLWEVVSDDAQTEHAVSLEVVPDNHDRVTLHLTFQRNILPLEQARVILSQFEALLYTTIFPPNYGGELPIKRRNELFSITPAKHDCIATSTRFLHEMVEQSAQRWPARTALEFATSISNQRVSKRSWNYKTLDQEANKVANLLIQHGALPGNLIGICFDKCPEASFATLGILKAGCAFVAIDPNAPEARKEFIARDSACTVLLCNKDKINIFTQIENLPVLAIDNNEDFSQLSSGSPQLSRELKLEDICYCLYTSGTTGQPKGCLISHGNAVQALLCFQRIFAGQWDEDSRWLQFASFHFDVSVLEQFWSWSVGICVTSAPRDLLFEDLPGAIRALQITHLDLTPSLAALLKPEEVPSLCRGVFITGGEQLRQDVINTWGETGVIYNFYGPSEVTIGCTVHQRVPKSAKPSNIGQQFDNVGTFVLDLQTKRPVLRGAIGELCLSGPLVGKGYLNRSELTEQRFEYICECGVRIYHTGDLVRILHDGSFEFLGRADDQVKLRGQRLEIGEINYVLTQSNAGLRDVATMVLRHPKQNNEHLVTFLCWSERSTMAANPTILYDDTIKAQVTALRQISESKLPRYMVPTYLIPVSVMPLSANNKLQLATLKSLFANTTAEDLQRLSCVVQNSISPDHLLINKVIGILSKRLSLDTADIKPSSDIFELGLDSFSLVGFSRSLKDAGFNIAQPSLVIRHPTVSGLTIALQAQSESCSSREKSQKDASRRIASFAKRHCTRIAQTLGIRDDSIEKIAPCTPLQEGMISKMLQTENSIYAPTFTYDLSQNIDLLRLQNAWLTIQSRIDILRTKFVATEDGFAQVVLRDADTQQCFISIQHETDDNGAEFERSLEYWYDSIRKLNSMPWKIVLREGSGRKVMFVQMFHALFDGISLQILMENVAQTYLRKDLKMANSNFHEVLPFGPLRDAQGAKSFWQKRLPLKSLSLLDLPVRYDGDAEKGSCVRTIVIQRSEDLNLLRSKLKVTMPALFHASWLLVLQKHFRNVPTLGIVVSGRNTDIEDVGNVIGPMFNTLPCLIEFVAGLSVSDLIQACHMFNVDSLPFQHTALRDISKWIGYDLSRPLFDSLFVFQKEVQGLLACSELWTARESTSEPDFPLSLEVQQTLEHSFAITLAAHSQYLDAGAVYDLLVSFENAIDEILDNPGRRLPVYKAASPMCDEKPSASVNGRSSRTTFSWSPEAKLIQEEVASLANAKPEAIPPDSTIFEVGLDSIDAIKLSARLKALGVCISVGEIMRSGTIERMAEACAREPTPDPGEPLRLIFDQVAAQLNQSLQNQGVRIDEYEKVLPATPLQEGMLANFEQYCSHDVLELESDIDVRRLREAWENVVSTNPILRTSFVEVTDPKSSVTYAQLVHKVLSESEILQSINWYELTVGAESNLDDIIAEQQCRILKRGLGLPTLDLSVVSIKTRKFLVLGMTHAIYDGWSINLLHEDVECWYNGYAVERPSYEPALRRMLDDQGEMSQRFWMNKLSKVSPSLFARNAKEQSTAALTFRDGLRSKHSVESVQDFCKAQGVTAQALGLTCYSIVLAGLLKKLDVCFGLVLSGRMGENFDKLMFPTMNTLIFSTTLKGSRRDMVKVVHDSIIEISEHQFFPLRKAKALSPVEGAFFDTLFLYQKKPQVHKHQTQLYQSIRTSSNVEYPINIEMEFDRTDLLWRAACKEMVVEKVALTQILTNIDRVLDEVMRFPNEPVVEPLDDPMVKICGMCTIKHPQEPGETLQNSSSAPAETSTETSSEWSILEELIREVLSSASGFPEELISKKTSLFSLGLDSINSVKVSSMLREKSISLPVSVMLKALTIEKMAAAATRVTLTRPERQRPAANDSVPLIAPSDYQETLKHLENAGILPENVEGIIPVTAGQEYVLCLWVVSGGRLFYSDFFYKCIDPNLTTERLQKAWTDTVHQFPILRTTFTVSQGRQILQVQMKSDQTLNERSEISLAIPVKMVTKSSSSGVHIKVSIHHALYDAVSLPVIISTLEKFCRSNCKAVDSVIHISHHKRRTSSSSTYHGNLEKFVQVQTSVEGTSAVTLSSSALNAFITSTRSSAAIQNARAFWTDYLAASKGSFPAEQSFSSFSSRRIKHYRPRLLKGVAEPEKHGRDRGLSFHSLFLAGYAFIHGKLILPSSGSPELPETVTIGVYLANRSLDIEGLVDLAHPTFSVVPLRIKLCGSIFEVAQNIQEDLERIGQTQNCGVSLDEIYKWTGVRINCCVNFLKLPQTEKSYGQFGRQPYFESMAGSSWEQDASNAPLPFTGSTLLGTSEAYLPSIDVEASVRDGGLDVGVFAPLDLLNDQTAREVLDKLQSLLSTI